MDIEFEKLPKFCDSCGVIGHDSSFCRKIGYCDSLGQPVRGECNRDGVHQQRNLEQHTVNKRNQQQLQQNGRRSDQQQCSTQQRPCPPNARQVQNPRGEPVTETTAQASDSRNRPWQVHRSGKIDKLGLLKVILEVGDLLLVTC